MAIVRFGAGAKVAVAPVREPILAQQHKVIDPSAIAEDIMSKMPRYDDTFGSALKQLRDELKEDHKNLREHVMSMEGDLVALDNNVEDFCVKVDEMANAEAPIIHPEVKAITHIKDVSKDVMEHVEANHRKHDGDLMTHANHIVIIESKLQSQMILNWILGIGLSLTLLSRLF